MIVKITVDYWHVNLPHTHIYSFKYNPDNHKEELIKEFKRILDEYDEVGFISFGIGCNK